MINKKEEPNYSEQFRRLAGLDKVNESQNFNRNVLAHETLKDGVTYGIVKENLKYVIMESNNGEINESSFNYIGGLSEKGKYKYRYKNKVDAERNFVLFAKAINESFIEERRNDDIENDNFGGGNAPEPAPGEGGDTGLNFDMPNEPQAPQDNAPEPQAQAPAPEGEPAPVQASPEGEAPQGGESDAEIDAEINSDGESENIDHYVGKLTAILRDSDVTELTDIKIKSILNSVISALPLENVSPEERLKIARRIRKAENVEEMDIPSEMMNEAKKIKEGNNTMENCKFILDNIQNGQHQHAKELFNKLRNKDLFFNYLDSLDFPDEMISGYKKYFTAHTDEVPTGEISETDEDKEDVASETIDTDEPAPAPQDNVEVSNIDSDADDELFKGFILKLATSSVGAEKDSSDSDTINVNGYKFVPTAKDNGFVIINVSKDDVNSMDFILTDDCFNNTYMTLVNTAVENY